jgi:hypothetical protein
MGWNGCLSAKGSGQQKKEQEPYKARYWEILCYW